MESRVDTLSFVSARAVEATGAAESLEGLGADVLVTVDRAGRKVLLFPSAWALEYAERQNPGVKFVAEM